MMDSISVLTGVDFTAERSSQPSFGQLANLQSRSFSRSFCAKQHSVRESIGGLVLS
jgi:hypothetical protein